MLYKRKKSTYTFYFLAPTSLHLGVFIYLCGFELLSNVLSLKLKELSIFSPFLPSHLPGWTFSAAPPQVPTVCMITDPHF